MSVFRDRVVFLAGPMRGYPNFNFHTFQAARNALRSQGASVWCPAERDLLDGFNPWGRDGTTEELAEVGFQMESALNRNIAALLGCHAVAVLPGWESSPGARTELAVALTRGIAVYGLEGPYTAKYRVIRRTCGGSGVWEVHSL